MKSIKFRIWDKIQKCLIYPDSPNQQNFALSLNGKFINLQNGTDDDYELSQHIGLFDVNGKDIYVGDICKLSNGKVVNIEYKNSMIGIRNKKYHAYILSNKKGKAYLTVIGNMFEQPDLFKENQ